MSGKRFGECLWVACLSLSLLACGQVSPTTNENVSGKEIQLHKESTPQENAKEPPQRDNSQSQENPKELATENPSTENPAQDTHEPLLAEPTPDSGTSSEKPQGEAPHEPSLPEARPEPQPEPPGESKPESPPAKNNAPRLYLVVGGKNVRPIPAQLLTANKQTTLNLKAIDPDKDPLKFQTNTLPKFAQFAGKNNGDATLTFAPLDKDAGTHTITITVTDGKGGKDVQSITVTVKSTAPPSTGTQVARPHKSTKAPYGHYEYLPGNYKQQPNAKFPLLIFLHGLGEKGNGTTELSKVLRHGPPKLINNNTWSKVNKHPFIVLSPQSWSGWWNAELIHQLIDYARTTFRVDERRVYLTGLSAGAISSWGYITRYQDQIAAIIPIAGNGSGQVGEMCNLLQIPVWAFHGDKDGTVGWGGSKNPVEAINKCNPAARERARLTLYTGVGHDSWSRTYDLSGMKSTLDPKYSPYNENIYDWLMKHVRIAKADTAPIVANFKVPAATVGGTFTFNVKATDADGHSIKLSSSTIGTFVTFKDNGGGNGTYTLKPLKANVGTHTITLKAVDSVGKIDIVNWKLVIP